MEVCTKPQRVQDPRPSGAIRPRLDAVHALQATQAQYRRRGFEPAARRL